jgi:hypothetical protein
MINVPGNSASFPTNVRCPATGDAPTQTNLGSQGSDLADRTAWLKANAYKTVVNEYTSGTGATYTVPTGTVRLEYTVVAAGQAGSNGAAGAGGNGGQAGEIVEGEIIGTIPASLLYTVAPAASGSAAAGGHSFIRDSGNTITVAFAAGGASTPTGAPSDITFLGSGMPVGANGGAGGTALAGAGGATSRRGAGGGGGGTNVGGAGGRGYGAGGGGGRQASGSNSGGGGGGGGYGTGAIANGATGTSNGANSAGGLVRFVATVMGI